MRSLIFVFFLGAVLLSCGSQQIADYEAKSQEVDTSLQIDVLDTLIGSYRGEMAAIMDQKIGYTDSTLIKFTPESPLSNFVADVVFERAMRFIDTEGNIPATKSNTFCLLNFGGLRAPINAGDITIGNIYELMPFNNTIFIAELPYETLDTVFQYLYTMGGQPLSNCHFQLGVENRSGTIGGQVLKSEESFFVVTSNYLFGGGDKMTFFMQSLQKWDSGILIRDALIEAVSETEKLPFYPNENRLILDK